MRVLALDWGEVRMGTAVSDPEGKIAFPLDKFIDTKKADEEIRKLILELGIEKIIIGMPKNLAGEEGISSVKVQNFVENLSARGGPESRMLGLSPSKLMSSGGKNPITIPIELVDERFTSVAAGKILGEQGMNEQKQRNIKDNIAAQIMLQRYLDTN